MLLTLIQIVLALAVLLIILSKYFDSRLKMIHTETGKEMFTIKANVLPKEGSGITQ